MALLVDGMPHEADWSAHAFQPLHSTHPRSGVQLQMHYGYEVVLLPADANPAAAHGLGQPTASAGGEQEVLRTMVVGSYLASFTALTDAKAGGGGRGGSGGGGAVETQQPSHFVQRFTGGECKQHGKLMGGLSAVVTTHCGVCEMAGGDGWESGIAEWKPTWGQSGLALCNFSFVNCVVHVSVALPASRCPKALPKFRVGFDVGTHAGSANAVRDGEAAHGWRDGGGCDGPKRESPAECATVHASLGGTANLTLWLRVLSGSAVVNVQPPTAGVSPAVSLMSGGASGREGGLRVRLASRDATLILTGEASGGPGGSSLEPRATSVAFEHSCDAPGAYVVRATLMVTEHVPVPLMWRVLCAAERS